MIKHNIQATNIDLTDAIRDYVESKLKALDKFIDPDDTSAHVDVEVEQTTKHHKQGEIFRAEMNLQFAGGQIYADSTQEDLYAAIDAVKDDLLRRLRKEKTKRTDVVRRSARGLKDMIKRFGGKEYE